MAKNETSSSFYTITALILFLMGILGGLYVGFYWALIGGIVGTVEAFKHTDIDSLGVALNVVRILFAAPLGWAVFGIFSVISTVILSMEE